MKAKHTPGPWIAEGGDGHGNIFVGNETGTHIASIVYPIHSTKKLTEEEAEANIRLIETAPKMLKALQSLVGIEVWIGDPEMCRHFRRIVYNTIALATGEKEATDAK